MAANNRAKDVNSYPRPKLERIEIDGRKIEVPEYNTLYRLIFRMQSDIYSLAGRGAGGPVLGGPLNMGNVVKGTNSSAPADDEFLTVAKARELFSPEVMSQELGMDGSNPLSIQGLKGVAAQSQLPLVEEYDSTLAGYYDPGTLVSVNGTLQTVQQGSPGQFPVPAMATPSTTTTQAAKKSFSAVLPSQAAEVAITWSAAFSETNYVSFGAVLDASVAGAGLVFERFREVTETGVVGVVWNGAGVALSGTLYAFAFHL